MRRGLWHQFGDKSQKFVIEQLQNSNGVGIILSPRDLSFEHAVAYAQRYHGLGADVLIDLQFYQPNFCNPKMASYPITPCRPQASPLIQITDADITSFASHLYSINRELSANGLIAPALVYEAGRQDIFERNKKLLEAAKTAGDSLGIPTYATVFIGRSAISSDQTTNQILSHVTSLNCDGYYYGFEFSDERIPSQYDTVLRCCNAGLTLATTGLPVLHAYAGPMALLSLGFGSTGTSIGHYQTTWMFRHEHWDTASNGQGGGGAAPARLFSSNLWGTIIYPDEYIRFNSTMRSQILTVSPFTNMLSPNPPYVGLAKWQSLKHLVFVIGTTVSAIASLQNPRHRANAATTILQQAVTTHDSISIQLADNTNVYQQNWLNALTAVLRDRSDDYDYISMLP